jgi:hypothetical protein
LFCGLFGTAFSYTKCLPFNLKVLIFNFPVKSADPERAPTRSHPVSAASIRALRSLRCRASTFNLDDNKVTLENVLAVARRHEKGEKACKEKETISNIFMKKEGKRGKATPSQPVQQPQSKQSSTNTNANTNASASGAKKQCNRCSEEHTTYKHRQNCPAKADTCSKCQKKGHCVIICHNGKRLNATGQVASATAPEGEERTAFEVFRVPTTAAAEAPAAAGGARRGMCKDHCRV